jgi:hypothetical protein
MVVLPTHRYFGHVTKPKGADPFTPPTSMPGVVDKNHLNREITPLLPTGIGDRCSQTKSNIGQAALELM